PSVPAAGVDTQPRTGSQTSTVQASSSAHSASLAHGGAERVDVVVELVDVVVEVGRVVGVVVELVDVLGEAGRAGDPGRGLGGAGVVGVGGGGGGGGGGVVELVDVSAEASASSRPKPLASSNPGAPMSTAPCVRAACTSAGVSVGSRSRSSAATPAECGAAADVPKTAQKGGQAGEAPAVGIATPWEAPR